MGAHSSAETLMAGVESDSIRIKATALAVQMTGWLAEGEQMTPLQVRCNRGGYAGFHESDSDLVEWCRSARDVLEAVGRG
jgi:hypothetical protein